MSEMDNNFTAMNGDKKLIYKDLFATFAIYCTIEFLFNHCEKFNSKIQILKFIQWIKS